MKKSLEFIPAFFCFLYFEGAAYLVTDDDDPPMDLGPKLAILAAPILGILLVTLLFWRWGAFGRRFGRYIRSMLLVLATAGAVGVFEMGSLGIGLSLGEVRPIFVAPIFVAISSVFWLPFTLALAAACCLPLWVWEGRLNPNHLSRRLARAGYRFRFHMLGIGVAGAALLVWDHWRQTPANPLWVYSAPKDCPFRLTTGLAPDGTEVVVAHAVQRNERYAKSYIVALDARNGQVRWEQLAESAFTAIIDPGHNLVCAGDGAVVTKLSGVDGSLLWQQQVAEPTIITVGLVPPVADKSGQIWVSGNKQFRNGESFRFLVLLEAADGTVRWKKTHAREEVGGTDPARIFPLQGGDACSVLPPLPYGSGGTRAWIMQRISGKNGDPVWEIAQPSEVGDRSTNVHCLVDEPHSQVVVYSTTNLVAYDLFTGKEKWQAVDPSPVTGYGPGVVAMSFDDHGDLVLWYSIHELNQSWPAYMFEFSPVSLFYAPDNYNYRYPNRNFRVVLSINNGRILHCREFGAPHEKLFTVLFEPTMGSPGAAIMQVQKPDNGRETWRAISLNHGTLSAQGGLPVFARQPRGFEPYWIYGDAVVTPSGKLVTSEYLNGGWKIRAW